MILNTLIAHNKFILILMLLIIVSFTAGCGRKSSPVYSPESSYNLNKQEKFYALN